MLLSIEKINDSTYRVVNSSEIEPIINNIINTLSLGSNEFECIITDQLIDSLVSRLVAAHFNKQYPTVFSDGNMYVLVKVGVYGRELTVSIGKLIIDNKTRLLNGILYK